MRIMAIAFVLIASGTSALGQDIPVDPFLTVPPKASVTSISGTQSSEGNSASASFRVQTYDFPARVSYCLRIREYIPGQSGSMLAGTVITDSNTGSFDASKQMVVTFSSQITNATRVAWASYVAEATVDGEEFNGGTGADSDFDQVQLEEGSGST